MLFKHALILTGLLVCLPSLVQAADLAVTSTTDALGSGSTPCSDSPTDCTLREAVTEANNTTGASTISLIAETYTLSLTNATSEEDANATGDIDVSGELTITGNGATINAADIDRTIHVLSGANLTLTSVQLTNGSNNYDGKGGGLRVTGTAVLDNVAIADNAVTASSFGYGGGIYSTGTLTISNSSISGNTLLDSSGSGGGLYVQGGTTTLTNTTVAQNEAQASGGGITAFNGIVKLYHSTVTDNSVRAASETGGGGGLFYTSGTTEITVQTSIIIDNSADTGPNCVGDIVTIGYSVWGDVTDCALGEGSANDRYQREASFGEAETDPLNNTLVYPLVSSSDGVDAVPESFCVDAAGNALVEDQVGTTRPQGDACDVGAYEFVQETVESSVSAPATPKKLVAKKIKRHQARLTWKKPSDSTVTKYKLQLRKCKNDSKKKCSKKKHYQKKAKWRKFKNIGPQDNRTVKRKLVKKLKAGTFYQFRARAVNDTELGDWAKWKRFKTKTS